MYLYLPSSGLVAVADETEDKNRLRSICPCIGIYSKFGIQLLSHLNECLYNLINLLWSVNG